jgi:peptidylprolyl isomerase
MFDPMRLRLTAIFAAKCNSVRITRPMDSPLRFALTLIAVVAVLGVAACGDDEENGDGGASGGADTATQEETGTETASPQEAEEALRDTSTKPVIPKPTGTPPRRLVKEDIVKGKGPAATPGDTVIVHYVGMNFSNGQEFDASWDSGSPFPVQLGAGGVIAGWEQGLVGIRAGGRRELIIPPELGYGTEGYPPDIPPNETLVFVIDAVSVN